LIVLDYFLRNLKKRRFLKVRLAFTLILLSGCAAVGIPSTSDPYEKLGLAKELFNQQNRPLPAERLIREAIEICKKTRDQECQAEAYFVYSLFFKSSAVKKWGKYYRKNGFLDKTSIFELRLSKSEEYFKKATSLNPKIYENRGITYYENGKLDLAYADFEKATVLAPKSRWAWVNRGVIYHEWGQYDKAIDDYNKAIFLSPNFAKAYNNRGNAFRDKGKFIRAISDFDKAISLNREDSRSFLNRGFTFFYMRQFDKALGDFERASALIPDDPFPLVWLCLASKRGGFEKMTTLRAKTEGLITKNKIANLISLYLGDLSPEQLQKKIEKADNKTLAVMYFHIGQYFLLQEKESKAKQMFQRVLTTGASGIFEYIAAKFELEQMLN
jgi:lipoprotein NlpI